MKPLQRVKQKSRLHTWIFEAFENPWVFNLNQAILDPGKGRHIRAFLEGLTYDSMIDVGCGTGNWTKLARGRYLGVDTSPTFVAECKRRYSGDPEKEFVRADVADLDLEMHFDLAILISVLHHLSDDEVARLVHWVSENTRWFFVLDLYPIRANPLSRRLYAMDRGDFIREPDEQLALILRGSYVRLLRRGSYYCPNRLYRHTLWLFESESGSGSR